MKTTLNLLAGFLILAGLTLNPAQAAPAPVPINDYLGAWTSTAAPYAAGNVVTYSSKTWLSLINGNTKKPGAAGTTNQWRLLGDAKTFLYKIGDKGPGGGWIFFVDREDQFPGFTYLEAAPEDVSGIHPWWCDKTSFSIPGASGPAARAIGRGKANTRAMLEVCTSGAANAATAYRGPKNKTDWFLPSIAELDQIYRWFFQTGTGGFGYADYWSSSEYDILSAWAQYFYVGGQSNYPKASLLRVRPVRAF